VRTPPVGAYGLRVSGIDGVGAWLGPVPEQFPTVHLEFGKGRRPDPDRPDQSMTGDRVALELDLDRRLVVDRVSRAATLATYWASRPLTVAERVHPLLTAAAAVAGAWMGYDSFHAAGIVGTTGVWGVLGDKGSGKSTLAAAMAGKGHPVACDDMLALRGTTAFAGPRCLDLRPDAAEHLAMGEDLGADGPRPRWRVALDPLEAELPLAGWIVLTWGAEVALTPIAPRDVVVRLGAHQTRPWAPISPVDLLDLAALPAWELRRPRAWSSLPAVAAALESAVG